MFPLVFLVGQKNAMCSPAPVKDMRVNSIAQLVRVDATYSESSHICLAGPASPPFTPLQGWLHRQVIVQRKFDLHSSEEVTHLGNPVRIPHPELYTYARSTISA